MSGFKRFLNMFKKLYSILIKCIQLVSANSDFEKMHGDYRIK
jgi:hypothetical protein